MVEMKLSPCSEKLINTLVHSDNPTQTLNLQYDGLSAKEKEKLDLVVGNLEEEGYIKIFWADDVPYHVSLGPQAFMYLENDSQTSATKEKETEMTNRIIFISHQSADKAVADILADFFKNLDIPSATIFCSSLPGNDVKEVISSEVKMALKNSAVNIAILSRNYYKSAYCLNEAGVIWYNDTPQILIALPEIAPDNMFGFFSKDNRLYRLDIDTGVSSIYDIVIDAVQVNRAKAGSLTAENNKLRLRYEDFIKTRELEATPIASSVPIGLSNITTDDERIVLYYLLSKNVRKATMCDVQQWLNENEIHNVNIDNAFDLLSHFEGGSTSNKTLEFGIDTFREYSAKRTVIIPDLKTYADQHTILASDIFKDIWHSEAMKPEIKLFISYIIDENPQEFGCRNKASAQLDSIKQWEIKNSLDDALSADYESCLNLFICNDLVYEIDWTSYGNPREYKLYPSLQNYLLNCPKEMTDQLQQIKEEHIIKVQF